MEPQTPAVTPSAPSTPTNNQLDPSVVALTKAIGQAESGGNYNAPDKTGDNAGSYGAYQMTPAFLQNWAPKSGIQYQPGQKLTPAQQDEIAYNAVKTMGSQGMAPAQIASAWNTGNPNAYKDPSYGKNNTYGSTQNYVKKIEGFYNQYMGTPTAEAATGPSSQSQSSAQDTSGGFSPADIGLGLVGMAGSAIPFLWKYAQKPLTEAATEAGVGALTGSAAGPEGARGGAGVGAVAGAAQGILQDITGAGSSDTSGGGSSSGDTTGGTTDTTPPPSDSTGGSASEGPTSGIPTEAQNIINNALTEELNNRIGGRKINDSAEGTLGKATIAESGTIPENKNGIADASSGISYHTNAISQAANMEQQAAAGSTVPMAEVISNARKNIEASNVAPDIKAQTIAALDKIAKPYGEGEISGERAIEARHNQYSAVKKDWRTMSTPEQEARKALGTAFRETSLSHSKNPHLQMAAIFEQQKHISARKVLQSLHNHPLKKITPHPFRAALYKAAAQWAEAYIGEKIGGPIGAILGYAIGSHLNSSIERKLKNTNFDTPQMKNALAVLRDTKPSAFEHIQENLKRYGVDMPDIPDKPKSESGVEEQVEKDIPPSVKKKIRPVKGVIAPPSKAKAYKSRRR